ncbi:hypothetical protein Rhal01_01348 [Rubritalea halochordaticola]|uniref:Uncharacterized protein n=1 Tax=Rubritalea halochordaticola TaxID=714537 RepID=A0ABP9UXH7_9BACT
MVDLSTTEETLQRELARTDHQMPVNIIYPSDPDKKGVLLTETFGSADALKALKYVLKNSK